MGDGMKCLVFLASFAPMISLADCLPDDVPKSWLKSEVTIEDIHIYYYEFCQSLASRMHYKGEEHPINEKCELGKGSVFKHDLEPGYKIYEFESPKECWEGLAGRRGYALEIKGEIVETLVTTLN